jgi:hypothetical protein
VFRGKLRWPLLFAVAAKNTDRQINSVRAVSRPAAFDSTGSEIGGHSDAGWVGVGGGFDDFLVKGGPFTFINRQKISLFLDVKCEVCFFDGRWV